MANPPSADHAPTKVIGMHFCTVSFYRTFVWTQFPTGQGWGGVPDVGGDPEVDAAYRRLARKLGYGNDTLTYCQEHDFCHSFVEQEIFGRPSPILWALAHDRRHPDTTVYEEALVQHFQGFMRGSDQDGQYDMTAVAPDIEWCAVRQKAWDLLARSDVQYHVKKYG